MLSLLTKNVFGRFMAQAASQQNMMIVRGVASKPNKTAKLKGSLKVILKCKLGNKSLTCFI
jgi:hypothetical protein